MVNDVYCKFPNRLAGSRCTVCGYPLPFDCPAEPKHVCSQASPTAQPQQLSVEQQQKYLGDMTAELLKSTKLFGLLPNGITPKVVAEVMKKCGLPGTCAGCPERQEFLNNVDKLARSWKRRGIAWLRRMFGGGIS